MRRNIFVSIILTVIATCYIPCLWALNDYRAISFNDTFYHIFEIVVSVIVGIMVALFKIECKKNLLYNSIFVAINLILFVMIYKFFFAQISIYNLLIAGFVLGRLMSRRNRHDNNEV